MSEPWNLKTLVADWLVSHGYDGLFNCDDAKCACRLSDLMPCDEPGSDCAPGYWAPCPGPTEDGFCEGDCRFHIVPERKAMQDQEAH